ncbi:GWxTD domain-containing protein [Halalkalibaculum sp. DA3122]|uniref:GWxTD domain-containing protein n=1 Tax=Halalkalibaculum sp. DA3122 TaxID=3373607 RepID=UPI003754F744
MAFSKKLSLFLLFSILTSLLNIPANAQRGITYQQLANQQREQNIFIDNFTLPGSQPETVRFVTTFRIDYNLLPFRKYDSPDEQKNFFSPVGMSIEIFRDPNPEADNRRRRDDFSVEGLEPVERSFWRDTAFAENYEQTKSKNKFITGRLDTELKPGGYSYILQFTRGEEVDGRTSRKRYVKVLPYGEKKKGNIVLAETYRRDEGNSSYGTIDLLNFGENVYYGQDFFTLIHLPGYKASDSYSLEVNRVEVNDRDTTQVATVHSASIQQTDILEGSRPELTSSDGDQQLVLQNAPEGHTYAVVKIPNSQFMNAVYQIRVTKEEETSPVAETIFRSRWIEMPTSLLNVDVAIDMLRFIVDDQTIREMKSGSNAEKEKKFRAFWEKRDPTPNTEYNELMAEYYRRIDHAYEQFSTINVNGYNTDQGNIYIKFGPPENVNRKFPPGEPAVEVWEYPNRQFVFRAVSGFGEFKLVSD